MSVKIHTATLWIDTVFPGTWIITNYVQTRKEKDAGYFETSVSTNQYAVPRPRMQ